MTTTTSNHTPAQRLRATLKGAGFNGRQVTVRHPHSTLHVTIRDASVSLTKVTAIANAFESVRRDDVSGEILCGGNTFVQVAYDDALITPVRAQMLALLSAAPNGEYVALPGGFRALRSSMHNCDYLGEVRIWGPTFRDGAIVVGLEWAAKQIAVAYLDAVARGVAAGGVPTRQEAGDASPDASDPPDSLP